MSQFHFALVRSTAQNCSDFLRDPSFVRLRRGFFLHPLNVEEQPPVYDVWREVAYHRLQAVRLSSASPPVFVGESALLAHGIPLWESNPNVAIHTAGRVQRYPFPQVRIGGLTIPGCAVRSFTKPPTNQTTSISGLECEDVIDALIRVIASEERLPAFVAACMGIRHLSRFDTRSPDASRRREREVKRQILARMRSSPYRRSHILIEQIVDNADAGCESVLEAALLWVVLSVCPYDVRTQFVIDTPDGQFRADWAIIELGLVGEADGAAKLGSTISAFRTAQRAWMARQRALEQEGWTIRRYQWADFEDIPALREQLARAVNPYDLPIPPSRARLWRPLGRCDSQERRFHIRAADGY